MLLLLLPHVQLQLAARKMEFGVFTSIQHPVARQ
jgi:hypothetical protein